MEDFLEWLMEGAIKSVGYWLTLKFLNRSDKRENHPRGKVEGGSQKD